MGVDALIKALADKIREKFGVTGPLSFAKMTKVLDAVELGVDVSGVTLTASEGLSPKKFVDANGNLVECTMVNHGAVAKTLSALEKEYGVPAGYHNGNGKIRVVTEAKRVSPTQEQQTVTPDDGKLLSQVVVDAIPSQYHDVSGVTLTASEGLSPKKFVDANGNLVECTMVNHGAVDITLSALEKEYGVPAGYHNGNGKVRVLTESKTVVPSEAEQIVTPSDGKLLSQVAVGAIPNAVTPCTLTVINNYSSAAIVVYNRYDRGTSVPVRKSVGAGQTVALDVASGTYVHVYPSSSWFKSVESTNISYVYTFKHYFEYPNGNTSDIYFAAYFQMTNAECSITVS